MNENTALRKSAGAGGIGFVVLSLIAQVLMQTGGAEPPFDSPASEITAFFEARNPQLITIFTIFHLLSLVVLVWYLGALWAILREAEGEPAWLSTLAFGFGLAGVISVYGTGGWELALFRLEDGLSPEMARYLFDAGNLSFASMWPMMGSMMMAAGTLALRKAALPRWLGWLGIVNGVLMIAARFIWADSGVVYIPYLLFYLWLIGTSISLIRQVGREEVAVTDSQPVATTG